MFLYWTNSLSDINILSSEQQSRETEVLHKTFLPLFFKLTFEISNKLY